MLTILFVWLIQFVVLASTGFLAKIILERVFKEHFSLNLLQELVLGLCLLSAILSIISIIGKISLIVFLVILLVCLIIFAIKRKHFSGKIKDAFYYFKARNYFELIIYISFFVFILIYASGEIRIFDTGLYHAQSMRWINEYGVVPGLGNLHSRFAFNSHFFISQAFFDLSFFSDNEFVIYGLNSFFFLLVGLTFLKKLFEAEGRRETIFYLFILITASLVVLPRIQSPSPDLISFLLIVHIMEQFYRVKFSYHKESGFIYIYIIIVIFYLVTVKLSNLPLLLFALVAYGMLDIKNIFRYIIIGSLFLIPFFIRNYYLSGYLIYPFPAVDLFHPDWKIGIDKCHLEINSIKAWAIAPEASPEYVLALPFVAKIKLWFSLLDSFSKIIVFTDLFLFVLIIKKVQSRAVGEMVFWVAVLINLLYWFISAPDPRFAFGVLTFTFAYLVSSVPVYFTSDLMKRYIKPVSVIILIGVICAYSFFKLSYIQKTLTQDILLPEPLKVVEFETLNGIKFTKEADGRCFYTKLPCACGKNEEITFRTDNIADGFKIKK